MSWKFVKNSHNIIKHQTRYDRKWFSCLWICIDPNLSLSSVIIID